MCLHQHRDCPHLVGLLPDPTQLGQHTVKTAITSYTPLVPYGRIEGVFASFVLLKGNRDIPGVRSFPGYTEEILVCVPDSHKLHTHTHTFVIPPKQGHTNTGKHMENVIYSIHVYGMKLLNGCMVTITTQMHTHTHTHTHTHICNPSQMGTYKHRDVHSPYIPTDNQGLSLYEQQAIRDNLCVANLFLQSTTWLGTIRVVHTIFTSFVMYHMHPFAHTHVMGTISVFICIPSLNVGKGPVPPPELCWSVPWTVGRGGRISTTLVTAHKMGKKNRKHGRCLSGAPLKPALL